jgi:hypothetical protein
LIFTFHYVYDARSLRCTVNTTQVSTMHGHHDARPNAMPHLTLDTPCAKRQASPHPGYALCQTPGLSSPWTRPVSNARPHLTLDTPCAKRQAPSHPGHALCQNAKPHLAQQSQCTAHPLLLCGATFKARSDVAFKSKTQFSICDASANFGNF